MTAKAHEISLEAGSKMAAAMKDVINAAAGITGFVLESARDLVQYMVRRGQMTQEEADKLIRQAEEAQANRGSTGPGASPSLESVLAGDGDDDDTGAESDEDLVAGSESEDDSEDVDGGSDDSDTPSRAAGKGATKHVGAKTGTASKTKTTAKKGASAPAAKKGIPKRK